MPNLQKSDVENKVNSWINKVEKLYSFVRHALQNHQEITCKTEDKVQMYEELMQRYGITPKEIPIFDLYVGKQLVATFKPIGLWVLGAKGRIDILTKKGAYILVDVSDDDTPLWKVFSPENRKKAVSFDEKLINKLVHSK